MHDDLAGSFSLVWLSRWSSSRLLSLLATVASSVDLAFESFPCVRMMESLSSSHHVSKRDVNRCRRRASGFRIAGRITMTHSIVKNADPHMTCKPKRGMGDECRNEGAVRPYREGGQPAAMLLFGDKICFIGRYFSLVSVAEG